MMRVADVKNALDALYPPSTAESWDSVGLVCGDLDAPVRRVLFAVDPVDAVVREAVEWDADMVVTHHPLLLRPVHSVATTSHKGRVVHTLIKHDIALHVAHTNADSARGGVNDALAAALGVTNTSPLAPHRSEIDKLVVFVPRPDAEHLLDALASAGAGSIGAAGQGRWAGNKYDRCAWTTTGVGTFRPGDDANPAIGARGQIERVDETRLEMVVPRSRRAAVVAALRSAHPYEEPAFDVYELAPDNAPTGLGRVGALAESLPLEEFVRQVAQSLPPTAAGVRATGDPRQLVQTVALCGGAGDSLLESARRSGADVFVTADLRHHPASEAIEAAVDGPALVDVSHWASEWPWLAAAAHGLVHKQEGMGSTVETRVSTTPTDPWTMHAVSPAARVAADPSGPSRTRRREER